MDEFEFDCSTGGGRDDEPLRVRGTAAPDVIGGEGAGDTLIGLDGNDSLHGCDDSDVIEGGSGDDLIFGGLGADTISGGEGDDDIDGGPGRDDISGDDGDDLIFGEDADDTLRGGGGSDTLRGERGLDLLEGGPGADSLEGNEGADELRGGTERDTLLGGPGNDLLLGQQGDDRLLGQGGADTLNGGAGTDTARIPGRRADTVIEGDASAATLRGPGGTDTLLNVEFIEFDDGLVDLRPEEQEGGQFLLGGPGPDVLDGGREDDTLSGLGGADRLFGANGADQLSGDDGPDDLGGGNGNDALSGGAGNDTLMGQQGDDTLYGFAAQEGGDVPGEPQQGGGGTLPEPEPGVPDNDMLMAGAGRDLVFGGTGNDTIDGQADEDSLFGGSGDDLIEGKKQADELFGEAGDDLLFGGAGNDTLDGGEGDDTLYAQTGDDVVIGGPGLDRAIFPGQIGDYEVIGDVSGAFVTGIIGANTLTGVEILEFGNEIVDLRQGDPGVVPITGGQGPDELTGGQGNDTIRGGGGNDTLRGGPGEGADSLEGQGGDDRLIGGAGRDELYGNDGADSLFGHAGNDELFGGNGNDRLEGNEGDDFLEGAAGADQLFGGLGDDAIFGGSGDDRIGGQEGDDEINGGGGVDTAVFPGFSAAYTITGDETVARVAGPDGVDDLRGIELLEFDDKVIDLREDDLPEPAPGAAFDIDATGGFDRAGTTDVYDAFQGVKLTRQGAADLEVLAAPSNLPPGETAQAADLLPDLVEALRAAGLAATVRLGDLRLNAAGVSIGAGDPGDSLTISFTEADRVTGLEVLTEPDAGPGGFAVREAGEEPEGTIDLRVRELSLGETTFAPGGIFDWAYEYGNFGNLTTPIEVDVYLSSNPAVTTSDTFLKRVSHPAGAETGFLTFDSSMQDIETAVELPKDLAPGTYYVSVIVDADDLHNETDESNNLAESVAIEVVAPADQPDFTVGNLLLSDTFFYPGDSFDFVYNVGNLEPQTGIVPTRFYLSTDSEITADDRFIYFANHEGLPSGQAAFFASALDSGFPPVQIPFDVAPGNYFIGAIADPLGESEEVDESNNVSNAVPISVSFFEPLLPDVSPRNLRVFDTVVAPGDTFDFALDVTNLGAVSATFEVQILFSTDLFFDAADTLAVFLTYTDLQPAQISTEGFVFGDVVPLGLAPGTYFVAAVADQFGLLNEGNEFNNISNVIEVQVTDLFA